MVAGWSKGLSGKAAVRRTARWIKSAKSVRAGEW